MNAACNRWHVIDGIKNAAKPQLSTAYYLPPTKLPEVAL
jgi:hypothetical protein